MCVSRCATFRNRENAADYILYAKDSDVLCVSTELYNRDVLKWGDNVIPLEFNVSPNQTETTNYSPLHRWAPIRNRARTISLPWLDSLFPVDELLPAAALGAGVAMETVVIVAIGVLATIFLASFIALVVVCRHRYCHPHDLLHHFDSKSVNQYKISKSVADMSFHFCVSFKNFKVFKSFEMTRYV